MSETAGKGLINRTGIISGALPVLAADSEMPVFFLAGDPVFKNDHGSDLVPPSGSIGYIVAFDPQGRLFKPKCFSNLIKGLGPHPHISHTA